MVKLGGNEFTISTMMATRNYQL